MPRVRLQPHSFTHQRSRPHLSAPLLHPLSFSITLTLSHTYSLTSTYTRINMASLNPKDDSARQRGASTMVSPLQLCKHVHLLTRSSLLLCQLYLTLLYHTLLLIIHTTVHTTGFPFGYHRCRSQDHEKRAQQHGQWCHGPFR